MIGQGIEIGWGSGNQPATAPPPASAAPEPEAEEEEDDGDGSAAALARLLPTLGALSEGYSGADIKLLCRDAAMAPMRRAITGKSPDEVRMMKVRVHSFVHSHHFSAESLRVCAPGMWRARCPGADPSGFLRRPRPYPTFRLERRRRAL